MFEFVEAYCPGLHGGRRVTVQNVDLETRWPIFFSVEYVFHRSWEGSGLTLSGTSSAGSSSKISAGPDWTTDIDCYLDDGGYQELKKAVTMSRTDILNEVKTSALRGRAWFPNRGEVEFY